MKTLIILFFALMATFLISYNATYENKKINLSTRTLTPFGLFPLNHHLISKNWTKFDRELTTFWREEGWLGASIDTRAKRMIAKEIPQNLV